MFVEESVDYIVIKELSVKDGLYFRLSAIHRRTTHIFAR